MSALLRYGTSKVASGPERTVNTIRIVLLGLSILYNLLFMFVICSFSFWNLGRTTAFPGLAPGEVYNYRTTTDGKLLLVFVIVASIASFALVYLYITGDRTANILVAAVCAFVFLIILSLCLTSIFTHAVKCNKLPSDGNFRENICNDVCWCYAKEIATDPTERALSGCVGVTNYTSPPTPEARCYSAYFIGKKDLNAWFGYWGVITALGIMLIILAIAFVLSIFSILPADNPLTSFFNNVTNGGGTIQSKMNTMNTTYQHQQKQKTYNGTTGGGKRQSVY